jgi:hypothetical protein
MEPLAAAVLRRLADGPQWAASFRQVKHVTARLRAQGLIEPVKPPDGIAHNMFALTVKGLAALGEI